ncbi:MAG: hypothetical protein JWQ06_1726, partial [Mucilaginibacter sp.]|nr:hypothetical protein [Mucilaginibacter sp.]
MTTKQITPTNHNPKTNQLATDLTIVPSQLVNVKDHGAVGNGTTDDTAAINTSMTYAKNNGYFGIYFPAGTYYIAGTGTFAGIIPLKDGISIYGAGQTNTHIFLSPRTNPNPLFSADPTTTTLISNITVEGIDFNGNLANQSYSDPNNGWEQCHAFRVCNGENITVRNCKFQGWMGDGCLFGNTGEATLNANIVVNVLVHNCEFYNIYREGIMTCAVNGVKIYNNWFHGDGFYVAGIDIERHTVNESVLNVEVFNNFFDFTDGLGPNDSFNRKGTNKIHYRRAVSVGFFSNYTSNTVDGLASGHYIHNNQVLQGQFDCQGQTNVIFSDNVITNFYEDLTGIIYIENTAIYVSDVSATTGLTGITIARNQINSLIIGNG